MTEYVLWQWSSLTTAWPSAPARICIHKEVNIHSNLKLGDNLSSPPANKLPINVYKNQFENSNAPHKSRSSDEYFYLITRMLLRYCLIHNPLYIKGEIKAKWFYPRSQASLHWRKYKESVLSAPSTVLILLSSSGHHHRWAREGAVIEYLSCFQACCWVFVCG